MHLPLEEIIRVCDLIAADAEADVSKYEGTEFNGKVMAAYQGEQNALIQTLALLLRSLVEYIQTGEVK